LADENLVEVTENSRAHNIQDDVGQQNVSQDTTSLHSGVEATVSSLNLDQLGDQFNSDTADADDNDDELSPSQLLNSAGKPGADEFRA